jgi:hypothetical protein
MSLRIKRVDAVRAAVAGSRGTSLRMAAQALFDAGGNKVLPAAVQRAIRSAVERQASKLLMGSGLLEQASATGRLLEGGAARTAVIHGARAAGRQVARSIGGAAAVGALVDGGWAAVEATRLVRAGSMTQKEAVTHVAREAGTGALATAAGTATAALLVAVTGGVAAPAVFAVAAVASLGAKMGLDAWLRVRAAGAIRAQLQPTPA